MISERNQHQHRAIVILLHRLFPFLRWLEFIGWDTLRADFMAGMTGAVIALPQGVAFAMIAGLPPEYGLYTAMVVPVIAALFGSSLHLISGPVTAISIIVLTSISPLADPGSSAFIRFTLSLTFLAGFFQLALGMARLGALVNFVSHSVIVGFTAGAAILIASSQLKHIFGLQVTGGGSFLSTWVNIIKEIESLNPYSLGVAASSLLCALLFKIFLPRWPGLLFAMIVGSIISAVLGAQAHGILLMREIPAHLPPFSLPDFSLDTLRILTPKALAVALIGLLEALSIARSIAARSRQQIDGNQEFIGQGLSNMIGSFFSSYAGSGSFTRSGINYQTGAMTPLSAIFSSVILMLILLLVAPLSSYLPISAMASVILLVAFSLIDFRHIGSIIKTSKEEAMVLLTTFLATLFLDLAFAVYAGVFLSLILYLSRTAHPEIVMLRPDPDASGHFLTRTEAECPALKIIRIDGSLFFGAVNHIMEYLHKVDKTLTFKSSILIVAYGINFIDISGAEMLVNESRRRRASGGDLYLCGLKQRARVVLERGGYLDAIGADHIFSSETHAVAKILARIDHPECSLCRSPLFRECQAQRKQACEAERNKE